MSRKFTMTAAIALALYGAGAGAASLDDMFSIRGFGTAGVLYTDFDQGDFVRDIYAQDKGVGRSDSLSADVDSKLALQIDAKFTERFSAVVQLVSESMYNNSWDDDKNKEWRPSLEWANLSYRVTDDLTLRGGRIVMPFLMNAEFKKVGYANPWMHAPVEVYGKSVFSSVDGGDISYKHTIGSGRNTIRAYGGQQEFRSEGVAADAKIYGLVDTYEVGALTLRASYASLKFKPPHQSPDSSASTRALLPLFAAYPDAVEVLNRLGEASEVGHYTKAQYYALGAAYDPGQWFAASEVFKADGDKINSRFTSAYVNGGVRIGKWTPYATYSFTDTKPFAGYLPTGIYGANVMAEAIATAMNAQIGTHADYSQDQRTLSLGLRWDVVANMAIKAQYDYVMVPNDSKGMFVNTLDASEYKKGKDASVLGLSVDFVF